MTCYLKRANTFKPINESRLNVCQTLPPGNYVVKQQPLTEEFYFEQVDSFSISHRLYGETHKNADRILSTFLDRAASTGVILNGEKGSGKTLLAKVLSINCAKKDIPTIIINSPWHGDTFNALIQSIEQPCMILFDEFEKVYDREKQELILTLFDGVFPSKKLFVLTCNDKFRVNEHMRNRPGRIYYLLDFTGLSEDFVAEYCADNLNDKEQIKHVCNVATLFSEFNFDMLKTLVEEMNRYNESAQEAIKMLNAKPQTDSSGKYKVTLQVGNKSYTDYDIYPRECEGNPLANEKFSITLYADDNGADSVSSSANKGARLQCVPDPAKNDNEYHFTYLDLKNIDSNEGSFTYVSDKSKAAVTFIKIKPARVFYPF